jgi:hypothetical protein
MTKGVRTSEFWLSAAAMLVGLLMSSGLFGPDSLATQALGIAAMILGALGYTVSRTLVKGGEAKKEAAALLANPPKPATKKK